MPSNFPKPSIEVPPEVLARILTHLEKEDLKAVRLVCKTLERSAVSLLFDEVYLSTNPAEIEIVQSTVRNFGKSIKTVFFSAVDYKEKKWGHIKNAVGRCGSVENVRLAYTNYCRLRQEQQQMLRAGTYFGNLCYALRALPNAQRLVLTCFEASSHPRKWQRRQSRLWRVGDCPGHCSIQGCVKGSLLHLNAMVFSRRLLPTVSQESASGIRDADPEPRDADAWSLVMMGLAATGSYLFIYAIILSTLNMPSMSKRLRYTQCMSSA